MRLDLPKTASCLFIVAYLFSVTSSIKVLEESYQWLYYAKHASVFILALASLSLIRVRVSRSQFYGVLSVLVVIFPFLFRGTSGHIVLGQYLLLYLAARMLSVVWQRDISMKMVFLLAIVAVLPILIDLLMGGGTFIYNSFYGRGRLLLGYVHPKEAGIALLIPILLIKLIEKGSGIFLNIICLFLLFFIQSRNALMFYLNFLFLSYGFRKIGMKLSLIIFGLLYVVLPLTLLALYFDTLDTFLSYRLSMWFEGNITWLGSGTSITSVEETGTMSKFHIDNFYLEYLIENGVIALIGLLGALSYFVGKVGKKKINGIYVNALFVPFLLFCCFDSGMFSTGNFLNLFIWSLVISNFAQQHEARPLVWEMKRGEIAVLAPTRDGVTC